MSFPIFELVILLIASFLPPILYAVWVRNSERYGREPWGQIAKTFLWGAVFAVIIALILYWVIEYFYGRTVEREYVWLRFDAPLGLLVLVSFIAPVVEEFAKGIGVYTARVSINEPEDGLVYGASSGFGFAATENLSYGLLAYLAGGISASLLLIFFRSLSSALLHASSTATMGFGIGNNIVFGGKYHVLPYYLVAVAMHSVFNFFASFGELYQKQFGPSAALFGFLVALIFAVVAFALIRKAIRAKDTLF